MAVDQARMEEVAAGFRAPVATLLEELHAAYVTLREGDVATYIPELASVEPDTFGIALATVDGAVYEAGDSRVPFTLQSISKPLTYGLVLEELGQTAVHARIGVEPSGDAFNSIALAPGSGTPANAMINAGAITAAGLLASGEQRDFDDVLAAYGRYAGRELELDEAVYLSEKRTGHRNRAIAHLLRTFDVLDGDPEDALDFYFRQCSVSVDCRDLALIGATLANGGVHPLTGERAVAQEAVRDVLSVMTSCGMYDGAGRWLTGIGLPAKSGVSGGIMAVLPGRLAIAVFSPRLDEQGNSVRGVATCRELSARLSLHFVRPGSTVASPIRTSVTLAQVASKRGRAKVERQALDEAGERAVVYELQGELGFAAVEYVARLVGEQSTELSAVIIDLRHITSVEPGGSVLLERLGAALDAAGVRFAVAGARPEFAELLGEIECFPELDRALESFEDALLHDAGLELRPAHIEPSAHDLLSGIPETDLASILTVLRPRSHAAGELVVKGGSPASELYLVTSGQLSVLDPRTAGRRLGTVSAGMTFGELGFIVAGVRTADVVADSDVELLVLDRDTIETLRAEQPSLYGMLLERLLASLARTTLRLDGEVRALAR